MEMQLPGKPGPAAVELVHVSKRFGARQALRDLHLSVHPGELVVLLGPNGAGKTTALSLMLGLRAPTTGLVLIAGQNPRHHAVRSNVGGMVQGLGFPSSLRVTELLQFFERISDSSLTAEVVLRIVGLRSRAVRRAGTLSAGERQRLLLGIALIGNPPILLLDEPTVFMDVEARPDFWRLARELANLGRAVLLSTHYPDESERYADRLVVLQHGRMVATGSPEQLKAMAGVQRLEEAAIALMHRAPGAAT